MSVTVDDAPLKADELGLRTVGQVLAHLKRENRLVVHVLIDGHEPDLHRLGEIRKSPLLDHHVFIETADPREMALDLLNEVESQLNEADRIKTEAADLLQKNQNVKAMEKLSGCFTTWQHAQSSLLGTARLMNVDLTLVHVADLVTDFATQLKQIRESLENRDFVTLSDLLLYETTQTCQQWKQALKALRIIITAQTIPTSR